jgi:hypothetical protein
LRQRVELQDAHHLGTGTNGAKGRRIVPKDSSRMNCQELICRTRTATFHVSGLDGVRIAIWRGRVLLVSTLLFTPLPSWSNGA